MKRLTFFVFGSVVGATAIAAPLGSDIGRDPDGAFYGNEQPEREQDPHARAEKFDDLDLDDNGTLEREEVSAAPRSLNGSFEGLDANNDGSVSRQEFSEGK